MIRYLSWVKKHFMKVPRLTSESMIPKSLGKLSHEDMVRKFDLRNYHLNTHFNSIYGEKYIPELEFLHKELNYRTTTLFFLKWVGLILFTAFVINGFMEKAEEKFNWNVYWHRIHDLKVFAELDEGGEEGDEPDSL